MVPIAYLGLIIFIIFFEVLRKKEITFDFLRFFNIIFLLMYPLPAFAYSADIAERRFDIERGISVDIYDPKLLLAIFLGYLFVLLGYHSLSSIYQGSRVKIKWLNDKVILRIGIFFLVVGSISLQIYSSLFGGIARALSQVTLIRMGAAEGGGVLVFFKHFMFLSLFGSYILGSFVFFKKTKDKLRKLLLRSLFVFSVIVSVLSIIISGGRGILIIYFLCFYLVNVINSKKIPWLLTGLLLIPALIFISHGKTFFFSLSKIGEGLGAVVELFIEGVNNKDESVNFWDDLIANFAFPIYSLSTSLNIEYTPRLFLDWIYGVVTLLPEKLLGIEVPETISTLNTRYIAGTNDFEIPAGMFSFGVYSLSWIGLFITCFVYGWIGRFIEIVFYRNMDTSVWMPFIYVVTSQVRINYFTSGDPGVFIFSDFGFLLGMFVLFIAGSKISILRYPLISSTR